MIPTRDERLAALEEKLQTRTALLTPFERHLLASAAERRSRPGPPVPPHLAFARKLISDQAAGMSFGKSYPVRASQFDAYIPLLVPAVIQRWREAWRAGPEALERMGTDHSVRRAS